MHFVVWKLFLMVQHAMSGQSVVVARVMYSLTTRLVHDIMEVLFAINGTCFSGDGMNLSFARKFPFCPEYVEDCVTGLPYPGRCEEDLSRQ
jgi:hypothetical protein